MGIPQWIYLCFVALTLFVEYRLDGHSRIGNYNFVQTAVTAVVMLGLLYWGGFFG